MNPRNPARLLRRFLPIAAAAAVGAAVGVAVYTASNTSSSKTAAPSLVVPAQPASTTTGTNNLTQIYQQDTPGVVDIQVTSTTSGGGAQNPFNPFGNPGPQKSQAEGTGFVIDTKGDILTAQHVVAGASSITVQFSDGTKAKATLVGSDKTTDTAVIHVGVPASELHPLTLGDSSSVQPGDAVVAIGSPFGLTETMTAGIVSAVNRTITAPNQFSITGAIQTDAAINHGNSGGPLIDRYGQVVGITNQILTGTNNPTSGNIGIGFAVPIDTARNVARQILKSGRAIHTYLGIEGTQVTTSLGMVWMRTPR